MALSPERKAEITAAARAAADAAPPPTPERRERARAMLAQGYRGLSESQKADIHRQLAALPPLSAERGERVTQILALGDQPDRES